MVKTKKISKKAVPKVVIEETKKVILTEDQYDELVNIQWSINSIQNRIKNVVTNDDNNVREIAFEISQEHRELENLFEKLKKITDDSDPNPYVYEDEDDNDYDEGYN